MLKLKKILDEYTALVYPIKLHRNTCLFFYKTEQESTSYCKRPITNNDNYFILNVNGIGQ